MRKLGGEEFASPVMSIYVKFALCTNENTYIFYLFENLNTNRLISLLQNTFSYTSVFFAEKLYNMTTTAHQTKVGARSGAEGNEYGLNNTQGGSVNNSATIFGNAANLGLLPTMMMADRSFTYNQIN